MARYAKVCPRCATKFWTDSARRKYCYGDCGSEIAKEQSASRQRNYKDRKVSKEKVLKLFREKNIAEVDRDARKAGMTYGQYVARQWCQEEIALREAERKQGIRFLDRYIRVL